MMMKYTCLVSALLLLLQQESSLAFSPHTSSEITQRGSPLHYRVPFIGRFRQKREVEGKSEPITVGTLLPDMDVEQLTAGTTPTTDDVDGDSVEEEETSIAVPVSIKEVVGSGNSLLVGMPGAFTTTCHSKHLPGYIKAASKLKDLGIDNIAVVTTNDRFVNDQWSKDLGVVSGDDSAVTMLCDADGDLVKELGLAEDMGFGIGVRSKRFALVLEDGTVKNVFTDEGMDDCSATSADAMVAALGGDVEETEQANPVVLAGVGGGLLLAFFLLYGGGMELLHQ